LIERCGVLTDEEIDTAMPPSRIRSARRKEQGGLARSESERR
jgi:hypothetical protein